MNVIVPFNPACRELSDADLEAIAGGKASNSTICGGTAAGISIACGIGAIFSLGTTAAASLAGIGITKGASALAG